MSAHSWTYAARATPRRLFKSLHQMISPAFRQKLAVTFCVANVFLAATPA